MKCNNWIIFHYSILSAPMQDAEVRFSNQNVPVVSRCRRCCGCKLFTFSSFSNSLDQFQPNLAQRILE